MKAIYAVTVAVTLLALAGCKNKEKDLVGKWAASANGNSLTLDMTESKTWTSTMTAGAQKIPMEGTWKLSGDTVTITPTKFANKTVAEIQGQLSKIPANMGKVKEALQDMIKADDFTLSSDGKTLTIKNPKAGQPPMVFTKSAS